jgi:glycosyltransferase involved in cell wall biosynthesis
MTKVLYITYDGLTDPLGQSQILPYLAGLAEDGEFEISIISCEKPQRLKEGFLRISDACQRARIKWHPIPYTKTPPILSTIKDIFALRRTATRIQREETIEIVHCRSYIPSLIGLSLKRRFATKFVFDMRGFWADERIDGGLWSLNKVIHRRMYAYFKKKEAEFIREADSIVVLTEAAKKEMKSWPESLPEKMTVIPCCADFDHFDFHRIEDGKPLQVRQELGIAPDALVIAYLGSIGTWYMADEMLAFFALLREVKPNSHLVFITNDDPVIIQDLAAKARIGKEAITAVSANRSEVPDLLVGTDINLFFIKPAYSKMASSPTKLAEVLGMGKPVICNTGVGDIATIFADGQLGVAIDVHDRSTWKPAIESIDKLLSLDRESIRERGMELFSLQNGVAAYRAIYESLRPAPRPSVGEPALC